MLRHFQARRFRRGQRGFSMVELSVAMLIALFLLGGLVTMVAGSRRSSSTQSALEQLQDNERIAMTLISSMVQKAGYFPDPLNQSLGTFLAEAPTGSINLVVGQVLGGTYSAAAPGDTFAARFYAPRSDSAANPVIMNCAGQSNSSTSATVWYTNVFKIGTVNGTSWLQCQATTSGANPVVINLIPNVTQISVLYGVSSNAGDDYSVVQYVNASQLTATTWPNVTVMKVSLTFLLPAYGTTGGQMANCATTTPCTTVFTRVIPIMSRAGVDT
ncbi:MAG TPA: PilW family protein [Steroidobacteraceae bacterium]|nr:PilW family protein [Steroidobacteraceae bacterium]